MTIGPQITIYTHHFGGITKPTKAWLVADLFPDVADIATFAVHRAANTRVYPWQITNIETGFFVPGTSACSRARAIKAAIAKQNNERTLAAIRNAVEQHNLHNHTDTPST